MKRWLLVAALLVACRDKKQEPIPEPTKNENSGGEKRPPGPPGANLDYFKLVPGCSCEGMNLRFANDKNNDGSRWIGWALEVHSGSALQLESRGPMSPPRDVKRLPLAVGVACSKDIFAVVTGDRVTGWSTKTTLPVWDKALSARYAAAAKEGVDVVCNAVPVSGGAMQIPLEGGKVQPIGLATGE